MGDLALAGAPILGRYTGIRSGHAMTNRLLHRLFADPLAYRIRTLAPSEAGLLPGAGSGSRAPQTALPVPTSSIGGAVAFPGWWMTRRPSRTCEERRVGP
jgi:hypothetical protein